VIMGRIKKDGSWDHVTYRTGEVPRIAADYLLKKGCRVCAHIGWRQGYLFEERANVFKEQIEKAGAVCRFYESPMNFERKDILLQLEQLKNDPDRPDGVFCSTDSEASAAAMFCYENGIRPERDISIIGCNNDTFLSHFMPGSAPATIDLRRTEIGTAAAEILLSRIDGDREPRIIQQFTPELIIPNQKERTK